MALLHVRYDGRSYDEEQISLDIGDLSTDEQVKSATAGFLGVSVESLRNFEVSRNSETGDITVRPEAVFGCDELPLG